MKKILYSILIIFTLFIIEFLLFNILGAWFVPNLILLFIIYIAINENLYFSIFVAAFSGFIKDSFSSNSFNIDAISFISCAFLVNILAKYMHEPGSKMHSLMTIFVTLFLNFIAHYLYIYVLIHPNFINAIHYIFLPEVLSTLVISTYFLAKIKKCALKLFV